MQKRTDVYKFKGNPLTLLGNPVTVGDKAPAFSIRKGLLPESAIGLDAFAGKNLIISFAPSLDTGVCATQTRKFNEKAAGLTDTTILTVTVDLPPAQTRFCTTEGIQNLTVASDYAGHSFGLAYGVLVEEMQTLARGVFVVDKAGVVRYAEITSDILVEPNYDAVLEVASKL
ncbi:MAG: thiol peroxidase [Bacteroidetes bacterium]|nr:thiol peroxidase [Bacteroidota bacterium]